MQDHPSPDELIVLEEDLWAGRSLDFDEDAYPGQIVLGGQPVELSYAYAPGEEWDGVTVRIPLAVARMISRANVEWAVPGLRVKQVAELLRALPKSVRKQLMPFPPKVAEICREFSPEGETLFRDLAGFLGRRYGVDVSSSTWDWSELPTHLRPRMEIIGSAHRVLAVGRDLDELKKTIEKTDIVPEDSSVWKSIAGQWERFDLDTWNFGDLPERVTVVESEDLPVYGWLGLEVENERVNVRMFHSRDEAKNISLPAIQRLVELALRKDLAWLEKDLRGLRQWEPLYIGLGDASDLPVMGMGNLKHHLLPRETFPKLTESCFKEAVGRAKERMPGLAITLVDKVGEILKFRQKVQHKIGAATAKETGLKKPKPGGAQLKDFSQLMALDPSPSNVPDATPAKSPWEREVNRLLPPRFLETISFDRLEHLPRYLKALQVRMERARLNPRKDQDKAKLVVPYDEKLRSLTATRAPSATALQKLDEFRWMIEEYRVSIFAQELGTAFPISVKRMDEALQDLGRYYA